MNQRLKTSFAQLPLLRSFRNPDLGSPYHLMDFQPFSLELTNHNQRIRTLALGFFIVGLLAISSTLSFEVWQSDPRSTAENAWLELTQGCFLLLTAVIQVARAMGRDQAGLKRDIRLGLALFAFALFLREIDIDKLGSSVSWAVLETTLRIVALILSIVFAVHMKHRLYLVKRDFAKILFAPTVFVTLLACVFYAGGWPFDRELFNLDKSLSLWFEETFELDACLLFLCASLMSNIKTNVKIQAPSF